MRRLAVFAAIVMLSGCGGATSSNGASPAGAAGSPGAGGGVAQPAIDPTTQPGVGPIDAAGQPTALAMVCPDGVEALSFKLPCLVGENFAGQLDKPGYHDTECQLTGKPDQTAVNFTLPLVQLPELLNQPVQLPFPVPAAPLDSGVTIGAERFQGSLSGIATFTQVDLEGRAFVARLEHGHVTWQGDQGSQFACNTIDGPLWGVAGGFL